MTTMAAAALLTPDDLIEIGAGDDKKYELSEGRLIEVGRAGELREIVKSQIARILILHMAQYPTGRVFPEAMFSLTAHSARIPDVAYVRQEKIDIAKISDRAIPYAPDLAIEVISSSESATDTEKKLREYLTAGVTEVWQVYPTLQCVVISHSRQSITFADDDPLQSHVLPELTVRTSELFAF